MWKFARSGVLGGSIIAAAGAFARGLSSRHVTTFEVQVGVTVLCVADSVAVVAFFCERKKT